MAGGRVWAPLGPALILRGRVNAGYHPGFLHLLCSRLQQAQMLARQKFITPSLHKSKFCLEKCLQRSLFYFQSLDTS